MEPVEPRMEMRFIQRRRRQPQGTRGYTEEGFAFGKKCLCKPAKPHSTTALGRQRFGRQWYLICLRDALRRRRVWTMEPAAEGVNHRGHRVTQGKALGLGHFLIGKPRIRLLKAEGVN